MGVIEPDKREQRFWVYLFLAGLIAGLVIRFYLASTAQTPGHGDTAFYYTVAKNMVDGRGLVVDYVVYFLNGPESITHYSGDFWNPLTSILLAIPMAIFGKSVFNATLASILFGLVPPTTGYLAGKHFSKSTAVAALTGLLTFFAPIEIRTSVATDSIIFFGAFGSLALYLTVLARHKPHHLLTAAICTGLAQFTRQDGILLLAAVEAGIPTLKLQPRQKLLLAISVLVIHLLVLSPLMIKNFDIFGAPFPPGPSKTMFLTKYEDFHAYGIALDWKAYRAELGIRGILASKWSIGLDNLNALQSFLDPVVTMLTAVALLVLAVNKDFEKLSILAPALLFAMLEFLFYTFVASFSGPGSFPKCLAVLAPFASLMIVDLLCSSLRSKSVAGALILMLAVYTGYRGFQQALAFNSYYNIAYQEYATAKEIILGDAAQRNLPLNGIIIMTRNPWDIYEATGLKAVMVPNNDLKTIYAVALEYGASYLILPAPRKSLQPIYSGAVLDPRFSWIATIPHSNFPDPDFKIFRIESNPTGR